MKDAAEVDGFFPALDAAVASITEGADRVEADCRTVVLHHGRPTEHVLLLLHGYTNCPKQWTAIAADAHAAGMTVIVPRAPGHGRCDLDPEELTGLTPEAITDWTVRWLGLARQMGDTLTVAGFSFGGVCAALAATRDEADRVVLIAPAFVPFGYPASSSRWIGPLTRRIPERYLWWDPINRERMVRAPHTYPRLSRRGIGSVFEVGRRVLAEESRRSRPLERATLILNDADMAINASAARKVFVERIAPEAMDTIIHRFPLSDRYPHDFIDPLGPNGPREATVRPVLLRLLGVGNV